MFATDDLFEWPEPPLPDADLTFATSDGLWRGRPTPGPSYPPKLPEVAEAVDDDDGIVDGDVSAWLSEISKFAPVRGCLDILVGDGMTDPQNLLIFFLEINRSRFSGLSNAGVHFGSGGGRFTKLGGNRVMRTECGRLCRGCNGGIGSCMGCDVSIAGSTGV